jgi:hypothetical protein
MDFFKRFVQIFIAPGQVFDDIRDKRVGWLPPCFWALILSTIVAWASMPIQIAVMELNPMNLPTEQLDQQIDMMQRFEFMWIAMTPLISFLIGLVMAGLSYIMVTILSRNATFKQYLSLSFFTSIVAIVGQLVSVAVVRARGLERIAEVADAQMSLSLRALAPEGNTLVRGFLGSIEFFVVWSLILFAMGLTRVFGMRRAHSVAVVVVVWVLYAAFVMMSEAFSGMQG